MQNKTTIFKMYLIFNFNISKTVSTTLNIIYNNHKKITMVGLILFQTQLSVNIIYLSLTLHFILIQTITKNKFLEKLL